MGYVERSRQELGEAGKDKCACCQYRKGSRGVDIEGGAGDVFHHYICRICYHYLLIIGVI